ncbi:hypothetical protein BU14_0717s0004 [Porphyra umbilicalis]|uniref:Uncharacterized protein n=1 Tax=Porphyra umbilicalis TaxID=2786 RepID=A0A1X6NPQ8_PORUM|nr:hypothetical protein BU14_0717s0004 [Porphyra umbilicalis]|eukprot:OSX70577.1 hypothetical protein BU14_0717s0004 [Porphyra umbilicalis]
MCPPCVIGYVRQFGSTHTSLRIVARNINMDPALDGAQEPSWRDVTGGDPSEADIVKILRRASAASTDTGRLTVVSTESAADHTWRKHALRQRDCRSARRAVRSYRRRVAEILRQDDRIVRAVSSGACGRVRGAFEFSTASKPGGRARHLKVSHGVTMSRILLSRKEYTEMKWRGVEAVGRVPHRLWTFDTRGEVVVWPFVAGTAQSGTRLYTDIEGRQRELARSGVKRGSLSAAAEGDAHSVVATEKMDEDPGAAEDPHLMRDLQLSSTSFLRTANGSDKVRVVALSFDGPVLIQKTITDGFDSSYVGDPRLAANTLTVAADGGPVCRRSLTAVTVTLSTQHFHTHQSPLLPLLYILSGEHQLHSGIGRQLREAIRAVAEHTYLVPFRDGSEADADDPPTAFVGVRVSSLLRLYGDNCMQDHFLSLTGGSDAWRCAKAWPCPEEYLLTPSSQSKKVSRLRTVAMVEEHWLLAVWTLARWCALRTSTWNCVGGLVGIVCNGCQTLIPYEFLGTTHLACRQEHFHLLEVPQAEIFQLLPACVMGQVFRAERRAFGGVRGYPIIPEMPIVFQSAVLHDA